MVQTFKESSEAMGTMLTFREACEVMGFVASNKTIDHYLIETATYIMHCALMRFFLQQ